MRQWRLWLMMEWWRNGRDDETFVAGRGRRRQSVGVASGSDMYWAEKLAVGFLGPYFGAIDGHSGLPVEKQLEVLRRVRFVGPDAAPQPRWSVHRNLGTLQRMVNVLTHSGYFRGRAA